METDNLQLKLGLIIKQLREEKNLSQAQLSYDAGVDRRYMSDIENGKRNISLGVIQKLARVFGVSLHELFMMVESL